MSDIFPRLIIMTSLYMYGAIEFEILDAKIKEKMAYIFVVSVPIDHPVPFATSELI